jgi:predicted AlkP superfamily pyrophosphatase or phosphodiesterase
MTRRRLPLAVAVLLASVPSCAGAQRAAIAGARAAELPRPTLVVMITVDQLLPRYFDRWSGQLVGGLGRLSRGGAFFTNAFQDHGVTETAPGHASTLSGRFPRSTGIVRNTAGVQDPQAPLIGGGGAAASPFRFRGSTLTDWLRSKDPRTRALSVSRKDRGAILPLGRAKQEVYWYAWDGRFTTSTYYADTLPAWVQRFNARRLPARYAGRAWTTLLPESAYGERDSVRFESGGQNVVFPHWAPADTAMVARDLPNFPWMDEVTLALALDGVRELRLGAGPHPDVLAVSLSTTDAVGHRYGPDSREVHDQVVRLDRALGAFLDSLFVLRDSTRVVIALTADHGVAPIPELLAERGDTAARRIDASALADSARRRVLAAGVDSAAFYFEDGVLFLDRAAFRRAGASADSTVAALEAALRRVPGVARVDRFGSLFTRDTLRDAVTRRWVHMFPPDAGVELVATLRPFHYWGSTTGLGATHGTPYDYDAHVPLLFYGAGIRPGRYARFARVVDIAPTLASLLEVQPTERLDGRVLTQALVRGGRPGTTEWR